MADNVKQEPMKEQQEMQPPKVLISALFGSLKDKTAVKMTIEQINQATAAGWAGKL